MHYVICLAYDGRRYNGWQRQGNTANTIQGKLEAVLAKYEGHPVEVRGSGRTDAGVHARGQVADFILDASPSPREVREYLNRYLPDDICILKAEKAPARFHSRLSAREKTYCYQLAPGVKKPVFERQYYYAIEEKLDVEAMREGAAFLTGTKDFKSFCGNAKFKKSTVRTITRIRFESGLAAGAQGILRIYYTGNGFLPQMVRILTGTLIEIGEGKRGPKEMQAILLKKKRSAAGFTAPPEGLFLESVDYGDVFGWQEAF